MILQARSTGDARTGDHAVEGERHPQTAAGRRSAAQKTGHYDRAGKPRMESHHTPRTGTGKNDEIFQRGIENQITGPEALLKLIFNGYKPGFQRCGI